MITFHIVSLFPDSVDSYINESIIKRAQEKKLIKIKKYNIRNFATGKHRKTDDRPYGGGPGMVLYAEPILKTIKSIRHQDKNKKPLIVITSPAGEQFTNKMADNWVKKFTDIIIICGRYEGIDARVKKILKAKEITIGPYILTGGELPALVMVDTITRRVPGVLGKLESLEENRVSSSEVYTRPEVLSWQGRNYKVPTVLLSGHKAKIDEWRKLSTGD
jgi:tRNA (guanine37-N1)-methyltransferase